MEWDARNLKSRISLWPTTVSHVLPSSSPATPSLTGHTSSHYTVSSEWADQPREVSSSQLLPLISVFSTFFFILRSEWNA